MWQTTSDFIIYLSTGGDEWTSKYYLMEPWQPVCISLIFILFVTVIGPKFMENRKPYEFKNTLLVYNAVQVALSLYLFIGFSEIWVDARRWFHCTRIPEPNEAYARRIIPVEYIYYLSKYTELLDTVFFVLRKKYNQVSFLHVYHHSSMPILCCILLRFAPASSISFGAYLNSFVHIVMYGYYMCAAMGPQFHKYLTWKKYLTTLQLIQFVTMFFHYQIVAFSGGNCNIPKFVLGLVFSSVVINFILFGLFYKRVYKTKDKEPSREINGNIPVQKEKKIS